MSTESLQSIADAGGTPSGYHNAESGMEEEPEQKLRVGFAAMPREKVVEIARMGGKERGRQLHEAALRGETGTARK